MKIAEVNVYWGRPRWGFVEIETDEGYTGWGEAVLEGHADAVLACLNEYKPYLIGKDPSRIEDLSATIYRAGFYRGGGVMMSALSGIDQALWDIKGKVFNAPVYELMGGRCRDKIRVYSWIGGDRPSDTGAMAKERMDAGFTAVKMNATEELQMIDSYLALLLPPLAGSLGLFLMKQFMSTIPEAMLEAAEIDGAGRFKVWWRIVMPNVKAAWLTVLIFAFQTYWNGTGANYIYTESLKPLTTILSQISTAGIARAGTGAAVTVLLMLPPVLIFLFSQSRIVETMAYSGIK